MSTPQIDHADVLAVFERGRDPGRPRTASEVADAVGCARRTAYKKLRELTDEDVLATKKVGARGRVWWRPRTAAGDPAPGESVAPADPAAERTRRKALRELHDATRELVDAERHERVCDVAVDAARRILGLSLSGLWLYDPAGERFEPVAWTEPGVEEYGAPPAFPLEGSLVGRAFAEGEYRVYDDVRTAEEVYDPDTSVRSELILPLGDHGVLNASSPEVGAFDEREVSLGRILAANVETALDRADRLEERRARRRELERQRDELETLNRINALIEDTIGALVGAATREEIEATVCERLSESDLYAGAWVVERGAARGELRVRTGEPDPPEDTLTGSAGDGPVTTAIEEQTPHVVPQIADDERVSDEIRTAAARYGHRSCLVAPLAYADTVFGGLVVSAPEPDGFGSRERAAFETLGRVVGFAINATNNRQLLLGRTAVELEVEVRGTDAWVLSAADRLDATVAVEGLVPTGDDTLIEYVAVEGAGGDGVAATVRELPAVEAVRVLAADDDRWFLECRVRESAANLAAVAEYGATVRTARAEGGRGRVVARFPSGVSPRDALAVLRDSFPTTELVAKRVVDLSDRSMGTVRQTVTDRLTDRQLTAVRAAYLAGYYDSPRGTTAQALAESLDIAPSTLYQHLQAANRKLLETVFDE